MRVRELGAGDAGPYYALRQRSEQEFPQFVGFNAESLAGTTVGAIRGVLNGTTTYVLSQLEAGGTLDDAVRSAQRAGYAEADPAADLSGADAAAKLAILATLAWGEPVSADSVVARGVDPSTLAAFEDVLHDPNVRVRLVASASRSDATGIVRAFVAPTLLCPDDTLYAAGGVDNVIEIEAGAAGTLSWRGPGAGGAATASALVADTIAVARALTRGGIDRAGALY